MVPSYFCRLPSAIKRSLFVSTDKNLTATASGTTIDGDDCSNSSQDSDQEPVRSSRRRIRIIDSDTSDEENSNTSTKGRPLPLLDSSSSEPESPRDKRAKKRKASFDTSSQQTLQKDRRIGSSSTSKNLHVAATSPRGNMPSGSRSNPRGSSSKKEKANSPEIRGPSGLSTKKKKLFDASSSSQNDSLSSGQLLNAEEVAKVLEDVSRLALITPARRQLFLEQLDKLVGWKRDAPGRHFFCRVCGDRTRTGQHMRNHVEAKHVVGVTHPCPSCSLKSKTLASLNQHLLKQHY
jgi:hypothetical protein